MTTETPIKPQPGDVVMLAPGARYYHCKTGQERAVIDSTTYGDDLLMAVFGASAHRPGNGDYVSCSGGPCPAIKAEDLTLIGMTSQRFWCWIDRPRAGGGVDYNATVNLWAWKGES